LLIIYEKSKLLLKLFPMLPTPSFLWDAVLENDGLRYPIS